MPATREDLVKIAREAVAGPYRPDTSESFNPLRFDPPEWVLEAMRAAYERGMRDKPRAAARPVVDVALEDEEPVL